MSVCPVFESSRDRAADAAPAALQALVEVQRLHFASQRIAAPPEQLRSFLAVTIGSRHRYFDQCLFEFWQRGIEQRGIAVVQLPFSP